MWTPWKASKTNFAFGLDRAFLILREGKICWALFYLWGDPFSKKIEVVHRVWLALLRSLLHLQPESCKYLCLSSKHVFLLSHEELLWFSWVYVKIDLRFLLFLLVGFLYAEIVSFLCIYANFKDLYKNISFVCYI